VGQRRHCKSRGLYFFLWRMRWAGHVARMGRGEVDTGFW
jgi:hypothetical protein